MGKTHLLKVTDSKYLDLACGSCHNVIYGYDEVICPSCGASINMDDVRNVSEKDLIEE